MEFPKKFTRNYITFAGESDPPIIIIRGTGYYPNVKIVEYGLVKKKGIMCVYKRR